MGSCSADFHEIEKLNGHIALSEHGHHDRSLALSFQDYFCALSTVPLIFHWQVKLRNLHPVENTRRLPSAGKGGIVLFFELAFDDMALLLSNVQLVALSLGYEIPSQLHALCNTLFFG